MAKLVRGADAWTLHAIGAGIAIKTPTDSIESLLSYV
jgi:tellurium resistance protein TerZ